MKRVAIVDFDVHHGDGTQSIVEHTKPRVSRADLFGLTIENLTCKPWLDDCDSDNIFFASLHLVAADFFPESGKDRCGTAPSVINAPYAPSDSQKKFKESFRPLFLRDVLKPLRDFRPDAVFISAGFDGHTRDVRGNKQLAHMNDEDFHWMTEQLVQAAEELCDGRVVSVLEGGYHLDKPGKPNTRKERPVAPSEKRSLADHCTLAQSVAAHVTALMGKKLLVPEQNAR